MRSQTFRCGCGLEPRLESTNWMISAYNSVLKRVGFHHRRKACPSVRGLHCHTLKEPSASCAQPAAGASIDLKHCIATAPDPLSSYYKGDASSHCTAAGTAVTAAIGAVPPRSVTSSRRICRGKCPAAQRPDDGKVQGSKRDHAQQFL